MAAFYPDEWFDVIRPGFFWWVNAVLNGELPGTPGSPSRSGEKWNVAFTQQDGDGRRAPAPDRPCAKITFTTTPGVEGRQTARLEDVSPTQADHKVEGMGRGVVSVRLFSAFDERKAAADLRGSLRQLFPIRETLRSAGITLLEALADERDLSAIFGGENEFRYDLEVPFRVDRCVTAVDYPWIETVNFGDPVVEVN